MYASRFTEPAEVCFSVKKASYKKLLPRFFSLIFLINYLGYGRIDAQSFICNQESKITEYVDKAVDLTQKGKMLEAQELLEQTIRLAKSKNYKKEELLATKNLMLLYSKIGNFKKAFKISDKVRDLAVSQKDYTTLSILYDTRATLCDHLGRYDESLDEYKNAIKASMLIQDADARHFYTSFIYYNLAPYYQGKSDDSVLYYLKKCREEVLKVDDMSITVLNEKKNDLLISVNMNLGIYYKDSKNANNDIVLSEKYFLEALKMVNQSTASYNSDTRMDLYQALQEFYHLKNDYSKAIDYGEYMLTIEKSCNRPYSRRLAYMILAKSYLSLGDNEKSKRYLDLYSKLNDSIVSIEKEAVKTPVRQIIAETNENSRSILIKSILFSSLILIIVFAGFTIYRKKKKSFFLKKIHTPNTTTVNKSVILVSDNEQKNECLDPNILKPTIGISEEMVSSILRKLVKFEDSGKFLRKDINLTWLSNHLNTNTKYISEVIKIHRNKNFNSYINGLRIQYITNKLISDPVYREYKISYLSEECGYASTQVFVIAFKKETGVTPSHFIDQLKNQD